MGSRARLFLCFALLVMVNLHPTPLFLGELVSSFLRSRGSWARFLHSQLRPVLLDLSVFSGHQASVVQVCKAITWASRYIF